MQTGNSAFSASNFPVCQFTMCTSWSMHSNKTKETSTAFFSFLNLFCFPALQVTTSTCSRRCLFVSCRESHLKKWPTKFALIVLRGFYLLCRAFHDTNVVCGYPCHGQYHAMTIVILTCAVLNKLATCNERSNETRVHTKGVMEQHATLRRVLRRFSSSKCFLEGFLEGACKGFQ